MSASAGASSSGDCGLLPDVTLNRGPSAHFAFRSDDGAVVGILGGDIVVRRDCWLARILRES